MFGSKAKRLWIDDVRTCPDNAMHARSVNEAKSMIVAAERQGHPFDVLDLDHDAGDFANQGGDYIKILDWLEATGRHGYTIRVHSMNVVGRMNMLLIAERNGWQIT